MLLVVVFVLIWDGNNGQESHGNNTNTDEIKTGDLKGILQDDNTETVMEGQDYVGSVVQDAGNVVQDSSDDLPSDSGNNNNNNGATTTVIIIWIYHLVVQWEV